MIKYTDIVNKYYYNVQDIDNILDLIKGNDYYAYCTQEKVSEFVKLVDKFLSDIKVTKEKEILERHETEEEAREYFGKEFIEKFDKILTVLDKQQTVVAIHGTSPDNCLNICNEGLKNKTPSLSSTAVLQDMAYGNEEMHYKNYEELLNWPHKNYKGLIIVAIPYECSYKEGLWNHFQDAQTSYFGAQNYKIDPDFIAGYIDVDNKEIIINPKYNRKHNYSNYVKDEDIFREDKNLDNNKAAAELLEDFSTSEKSGKNTIINGDVSSEKEQNNLEIDIERIPLHIESVGEELTSLKLGFPGVMDEKRYKSLLEDLSIDFDVIKRSVPLLKTDEQLKELKAKNSFNFDDTSVGINEKENDYDFSIDDEWDDDFEWNDDFEHDTDIYSTDVAEKSGKKM